MFCFTIQPVSLVLRKICPISAYKPTTSPEGIKCHLTNSFDTTIGLYKLKIISYVNDVKLKFVSDLICSCLVGVHASVCTYFDLSHV